MSHLDSSNIWPAKLIQLQAQPRARGILFRSIVRGGWFRARHDRSPVNPFWRSLAIGLKSWRQDESRDPYRWPFLFLYLFTFLLYIRPNDLIPAMGVFPLTKIIAIIAPLTFVYTQYKLGKPIINWTIEVKMIFVMLALSVLFTPFAVSPIDSVRTLNETFIKVVIIFLLMIALINTRERLRSLIRLTVLCGTWLAIFAIRSYARGDFAMPDGRIKGIVGGIFGNPNDLALALNLLIPLAVALALTGEWRARYFYALSALIMTGGVIVTFSRAGFISLVAQAGVMIWKFGRGMRVKAILATLIPSIILLAAVSDRYHNRLTSIVDFEKDETGSAQQRRDLLIRGFDLAVRHPFIGVGIGNFHIYSIRERVAHNSYLETAAELGAFGLIAYLILILAPLRGLARIERETLLPRNRDALETKFLSIGLQAALVAYLVNSFFSSCQYLWYLYYVAGYAVALRRIYAPERAVPTKAKQEASFADQLESLGTLWKSASRKPDGILWPARRFRKGF